LGCEVGAMNVDWNYLIAIFLILTCFGIIWHWREPAQDRDERMMIDLVRQEQQRVFKCEACKRGKGMCRVHLRKVGER